MPLQKLAARTTGGQINNDGSAASAAAYSADNVQASSQLQPRSRLDPPANSAFVLSRAGDDCLEPDGCVYPEDSLTSEERRRIGNQFQDDDEAVSTASRERGPAQGYIDDTENAAQVVEGSDSGGTYELVGDADEYEMEDHDRTAVGGSGGGDGGDDYERDEQSAERRQPGNANFGSAEPGGQLSSNKMATAVDGDEKGGNSSDDNDDEDHSIKATAAAADGEPPARRGDWWSTAAAATTASAVGSSKEVNVGDAAAGAAAEDDDDVGGDTVPPAPKMPPPPPCSDGAPAGVSLDVLKTSAVGGKGLRSAVDANATLDNENLSAVLATTFGSVSVVLLLIINGFVIRRTWVHGCWQKKAQVLLRPRRVAFRRRNNRYGTTRSTEPDETEM